MGVSRDLPMISDVEGCEQVATELDRFCVSGRFLKNRPNFPVMQWSLENHRLFSNRMKRLILNWLCCLKRANIYIPLDIIRHILMYIYLSDDFMSHVVQLENKHTRIYSFHKAEAIDLIGKLDCDGELRIVTGRRQYPTAMSKERMCVSIHDGTKLLYWRRLRDGSDYSWRTTEMSEEELSRLQVLLFGRQLFPTNSDWLVFLKNIVMDAP